VIPRWGEVKSGSVRVTSDVSEDGGKSGFAFPFRNDEMRKQRGVAAAQVGFGALFIEKATREAREGHGRAVVLDVGFSPSDK
jgi:hypothetical protein